MEIRMRQFIKYLIFIINILLFVTLSYECYNITGWYKIIPIVLAILQIALFFILLGLNNKNRYVIISPKLGKKVKHESGEYYVIDDSKKCEYRLYVDYIVYMKRLYNIDYRYVNTPDDLKRNFKNNLDSFYQTKAAKKRRENILKNWDGYTCQQTKIDDKINQVIN